MNTRRLTGAAGILLVAIAVAGVPAVARSVVKFARNAAHVHGISATRSKSCVESPKLLYPDCSARVRKLVAANDKGYLPNDIIRKADDSARLGGTDADRFVQRCTGGNAGYADIPAETPTEWGPVYRGFGEVREYGGPPRAGTGQAAIDRCTLSGVAARRRSTGVYEVAPFATFGSSCGSSRGTIPSVATVNDERPLLITYETLAGCDSERGIVLRVHIFTTDGVPTDASFSMSFLEPAQILYP